MKVTINYQVCIMASDKKGAEVKTRHTITAGETLASAYAIAIDKYGEDTPLKVYPICTAENGESIMTNARKAVKSYETFERNNDFASENPRKRNFAEREDLLGIAYTAICEYFADNPNARNMDDIEHYAFKAIARDMWHTDKRGKKETMYNPDFGGHNSYKVHIVSDTIPELSDLVRYAWENADLSINQEAIIDLLTDGHTYRHIAELLDIASVSTISKQRSKAIDKIFCSMLDAPDGREIIKYHLSIDDNDIGAIATALRDKVKRAKGK